MESGLEDRNNMEAGRVWQRRPCVSMESGLEDRNNVTDELSNKKRHFLSQWSPA